eukprot:6201524-Pleurochrysis_carterae.AAC.1
MAQSAGDQRSTKQSPQNGVAQTLGGARIRRSKYLSWIYSCTQWFGETANHIEADLPDVEHGVQDAVSDPDRGRIGRHKPAVAETSGILVD